MGIRMISPFCTVGSDLKDQSVGPMPAHQRYLGAHIEAVQKMAGRRPFLILSGKLGLISAKAQIEYYHHPLVPEEIDVLADIVKKQIVDSKIRLLYYCKKADKSWAPYDAVLSRAAAASKIGIITMMIPAKQEVIQTLPLVADAPALA